MKSVSIIDYGMGNIRSLYNSLKYLGYNPVFYSETNKIKSNVCILPGVGAFNHAMNLIKKKKILNCIESHIKNKNNLLLGICLGMQLLLKKSSENISTTGLGIINGKVTRISKNKNHIVPNVGSFETFINSNKSFNYLAKFNKQKFYYVHSFVAEPSDSNNQIATSKFYDKKFCAIVIKNSNIIGTQFHPEKSSEIGLEFLQTLIGKFN
jgi:glutamine amidotransferase